MKYLKKLLKGFIYSISSLLILGLLLTVLNYFGVISYNITAIGKIIIPLLSLAIGGFVIGKNSNKNGWIEGLKFGLILSLIFLIITIILNGFKSKDLIFISLLIISSIFGSMFGINSKTN